MRKARSLAGAAEPPPVEESRSVAALDSFYERVAMVLALTGIERLEDLKQFLLTGDYSVLPTHVVRRMRGSKP